MKFYFVSDLVHILVMKANELKDFELHLTDPRDIIDHWGEEFPEVIRNTKKNS